MAKIKVQKNNLKIFGIVLLLVLVLVSAIYLLVNYKKSFSSADSSSNIVNFYTPHISSIGAYQDNYLYTENGLAIYTYATGPFGTFNATVGGLSPEEKEITYTMVVTNPSSQILPVNLRFKLSSGFSFIDGSTTGTSIVPTESGGYVNWAGYDASAGESSISFKLRTP